MAVRDLALSDLDHRTVMQGIHNKGFIKHFLLTVIGWFGVAVV